MPIVKETSTRLQKFGYNFTVLPQQVIQKIKNPVALAYWTYLLSLPDDWNINRTHLMDHFGVGRARHDAAMSELKELGLLWVKVERTESGMFDGRKWMVGAIPLEDLPIDDSPKVGKPTTPENRPLPETDHIQIEPVITNRNTVTNTPHTPLQGGVSGGVDRFDEFYDAYPKKTDKAAARKAWKKLNPSPELVDTLITDVKNRVEQGEWMPKTHKQFIPGPAPYLNGRKWENEIIPRAEHKPSLEQLTARTRQMIDDLNNEEDSWSRTQKEMISYTP